MKERIPVQTSLLGIANKAKSDKQYRFRNLYRELNEELLLDSWRLLRKDAALGVDRVSRNSQDRFRGSDDHPRAMAKKSPHRD